MFKIIAYFMKQNNIFLKDIFLKQNCNLNKIPLATH